MLLHAQWFTIFCLIVHLTTNYMVLKKHNYIHFTDINIVFKQDQHNLYYPTSINIQ